MRQAFFLVGFTASAFPMAVGYVAWMAGNFGFAGVCLATMTVLSYLSACALCGESP